MRRRIGSCLVAFLMLAAMTVPSLAADVHIEDSKYSVTVTEDSTTKGKFAVTIGSVKKGNFYLVIVTNKKLDSSTIPTTGNIEYIDQITAQADGNGEMTVFPKEITRECYMYLSATGSDLELVATISSGSSGPMVGDANGDGSVSISDATVILRHLSGKTTLTGDKYASADINGDGDITINDVTLLLRHLSGKPVVFFS